MAPRSGPSPPAPSTPPIPGCTATISPRWPASGLTSPLPESNVYLVGVPGASDAFAAALWALDHLPWWAAHGAAGINFHNRRQLSTATIVPDPAGGEGWAINPKGYGIKA